MSCREIYASSCADKPHFGSGSGSGSSSTGFVSKGNRTRQDIGLELGWAINSVTGRARELLDDNNICGDGKDYSNTVARSLLRVVGMSDRVSFLVDSANNVSGMIQQVTSLRP